jgi:CDP-4-dehydro-6-deoxyglucose reductase
MHRVTIADTGEAFPVEGSETLLAAATRAGIRLAHACMQGGCGTCRVRVTDGQVAYEQWPLALAEDEAAQGYALACRARVTTDLVIDVPRIALAAPGRHQAMIVDVERRAEHVTHLKLVLPELSALEFRPGQHMNVHLPDGRTRSFSMASKPSGNEIDFHIRRIPGGRFTDAALTDLMPGDLLDVELPLGTFRFHDEDYRELVMVATGTGIAPLKSILESLHDDADCPPVALYWGVRDESWLYLDDEIRGWAERLYEFRYQPVLSRPGPSWEGRTGHVQDAVLADLGEHGDLSEHSIYLCGSPNMIRDAKRAFLDRGASVDHLYADGFNFQSKA